jgi:hypothetical protein
VGDDLLVTNPKVFLVCWPFFFTKRNRSFLCFSFQFLQLGQPWQSC